MASIPITIPNVFAGFTSNIALSLLDADFATVADAINTGLFPLAGTTSGSDAAAGNVGEYIIATNPSPVAQSGTAVNIAGFQLDAGDWDVEGYVRWAGSSGASCLFQASLSLASGTIDVTPFRFFATFLDGPAGGNISANIGPARFSIATVTPIYLVAMATAGADIIAYGSVRARRIR